jgi:hypothetical protein
MKITKTFAGVFLLTFLIGYVSVLPTKKTSAPNEPEKITLQTQNHQDFSKELPEPTVESKPNLRTFQTEGFWEKYKGQYNKRLLETGEVSNVEDIKAKSGEKWFGLFNKNGKDFLRLTEIKVSWTDSDWKKVSVKDKTEPLFLLKNGKNLKQGEVKTLLREKNWQEESETDETEESNTVKEGFVKKFDLGERKYTLRAEKGLDEEGKTILVLLLESGNKSQIVHFIYYMEAGDYVGNLYWVGDLDRDGKLDLYMDFYGYEKGGYETGLFLSSEAEKGNLVGKIEYFMLGGC